LTNNPITTLLAAPAPPPGFGVYLHWPFCAAKCPYCDFNSHVRHQQIDQAAYAAAFRTEIATTAATIGPQTVNSIFIGGGTPSLMDPKTVEQLIDTVAANWSIAENCEISLEANPSSVEAERFRGYRAAGVNRVSLGVQALSDTSLRALGRLHNTQQAIEAIEIARAVFDRLSFDLIYARPIQTLKGWQTELEQAISMAADHLSLYQLTIEENTPFYHLFHSGKIDMPDAELAADFFSMTQDITDSHGLPAYEISNHAKPGSECQHNLLYWRYGTYAGIGPGAHGRLTTLTGRLASVTEPNPERWLERVGANGHGMVELSSLDPEQCADEMLLMGLRLREGISLTRFAEMSGRQISDLRIDQLVRDGMIVRTPEDQIRATSTGWLVLDAVVADLFD
jgi:oxygen-independent coproporphyrinogen-3 oxidase